jgi:methyl-accepting chemotaxis protein
MSTALLVTLTVVEIVVLLAVLALFIILITRRLRSIADALEQVSGGNITQIQSNVLLLGAGAALLNRKLDAIASVTPAMAEKAESMASKSAQAGSHAAGPGTAQYP